MFGISGSEPVRFHEDYEPGVSGISLAKRSGVEITDLAANAARVGARSSCATRPCANRNRKSHSCLARPHELVGKVVAIPESRIATRMAAITCSAQPARRGEFQWNSGERARLACWR